MTKIILDLFGGTGCWGKPYAEAGYTVHNITLPAYDVAATETGAVLIFKGGSAPTLTIPARDVYGILSAPPGIEFSHAKTCRPGVVPDFRAGYKCPPGWARRAARRSMTPPGFARAFFMANR